jgi:hypothetical protein
MSADRKAAFRLHEEGGVRRTVVVCLLALGVTLPSRERLAAHETEVQPLVVASSEAGGGALRIVRDGDDPVVLEPSATVDDFVLFTAGDPSFEIPEGPAAGVFPLSDGTRVTVELVARTGTAAVKLRGVTLALPGDSVVLGTMPSLHAHPEWQLTLPDGERGCETLRLRLHADGYASSDEYEVRLTESPASCAGSGPVCGDADGDGAIDVADGVLTLRAAADLPGACADPAACDLDGDGEVAVSDGVNVLRMAAELPTVGTCPDL